MGEETEMSESVSSEYVKAAGEVAADEPHMKVEHRKRKKTLYKALREQIEFYLGDANLTKERFFHDLIQGKPFVYMDLSVFLACNKIKLLTSRVEDLAKALKHSELLQLSPDGTKVCRITPIVPKTNVDECTIYVEQLGPDVDHSSLTKMFSHYGVVDYVSIPKFSNTNKTKGFAFVEFKDAETAQKVLEVFKARGCCLSPQMAPNELQSIKNFNSENREVPSIKNQGSADNMEQQQVEHREVFKDKQENLEMDQNDSCDKKVQKLGKKRKRSEDNEVVAKKPKDENNKCQLPETAQDEKDCKKNENKETVSKHVETVVKHGGGDKKKLQEDEDVVDTNIKSKNSKKRKHSTGNENADNSSKNEDNIAEPEKKKAKSETEDGTENETSQTEDEEDVDETVKQKKKRKRKRRNKKDKSGVTALLGLKVLSKKEWKQLRNKYLNMQRETMHCLKQHLQHSRREKARNVGQAVKSARNLAPGTVIKVTLQEPVNNINSVKSDMRINPDIKYVDATEGSPVVYLRTSTAELANSLVQTKNWPDMEVIKGEEENKYWDKIEKDRENQFYSKKKQKKQNERGRNKLLKRAERFQGQHITTLEASPNQS